MHNLPVWLSFKRKPPPVKLILVPCSTIIYKNCCVLNILVTGASIGFGKAIGEFLLTQHHTVTGTSRQPEKYTSTFPLLALDVNDDKLVMQCLEAYIQTYGKIDVLINNAGFGIAGPIEDTSLEEAKAQFETNFFGAARMIKATLPYMRAQNSGLIINISSIAGQMGLPFQAYYSACKFALEGFTEALRMELKPWNIQVTNIEPGDYKTSFTINRQIIRGISPAYQEKFNTALRQYEYEENNGSNPLEVAKLIARIINMKKPVHIRYLSGTRLQKFAVFLKKIFNGKVYEKIMLRNYRL